MKIIKEIIYAALIFFTIISFSKIIIKLNKVLYSLEVDHNLDKILLVRKGFKKSIKINIKIDNKTLCYKTYCKKINISINKKGEIIYV